MSEETSAVSAPQITVDDLRNLLKILDVAATRGAFQGNELSAVGGVRDKLALFLDAVTPKEETPVENPVEEPKADAEATA